MPSVTTKDGVEIFYKDWGKGQPIVFSHGWPLSADDWDAQMLFFLNQGFRVVAHDRRGHGRSTQVGDGHDMDHYADDLLAVVQHLDRVINRGEPLQLVEQLRVLDSAVGVELGPLDRRDLRRVGLQRPVDARVQHDAPRPDGHQQRHVPRLQIPGEEAQRSGGRRGVIVATAAARPSARTRSARCSSASSPAGC